MIHDTNTTIVVLSIAPESDVIIFIFLILFLLPPSRDWSTSEEVRVKLMSQVRTSVQGCLESRSFDPLRHRNGPTVEISSQSNRSTYTNLPIDSLLNFPKMGYRKKFIDFRT